MAHDNSQEIMTVDSAVLFSLFVLFLLLLLLLLH